MSGPYKIVIFDDSCHLFVSTDTGDTWTQHGTPAQTMTDDWADMAMDVNDNDYSTVVLFDLNVNALYGDGSFAGDLGGIILADADAGNTANETILSYSASATTYSAAVSGAFSGDTILVAPVFTNPDFTGKPRLSTNAGTSWSEVSGLSAARWTRACMSQNADVMYIHEYQDYPNKSTDGGATWTQLTNGPTYAALTGQSAGGLDQNSLRFRCSQNGQIVASIDWFGNFYISTDAGDTWSNTDFPSDKLSSDWDSTEFADFGMSLDGSVIFVGIANDKDADTGSYFFLSTDFGETWQELTTLPSRANAVFNVNVSPDGVALVVVYSNGTTTGLIDVSVDQGITWSAKTFTMLANPDNVAGEIGDPGTHVSAYILPQSKSASTIPAGDPNLRPLIGATYRRTNAFSNEAPAFVGWHRHDFGHDRNELMSIGTSADTGGLLDHLDMVTTDGSNYFVEGMTQIFDEEDDLTDAWFLDGALTPDSAYEDTVGDVTGVRFTGLWYLRTKFVTVCAFGLDLGDFTVEVDGTVLVPYGSGTAPSSFDYTSAGAGAYLFTSDYITANVQATAPRNGGVYIESGYMPAVVGFPFVSDGQILRPIAPEQAGTRSGPAFGALRRAHYVKALLKNTIGISFGTDFSTTLQQAALKSPSGVQPAPTAMYSGLWRETLNSDYDFDGMVSWRIVRPYPASVVSIGASEDGTDA